MRVLVTGCCGFIGFHLANALLRNKKYAVFGIDNLNNYYDIKLKKKRLQILKKNINFFFSKIDIRNHNSLKRNFIKNNYDIVIHLAAQAGVRYSLKNPRTYIENNINGFFNVLNLSHRHKVKHFLYASSSSVYGNQKKFPVKENASTDFPISVYGATKKSNEVLAYSYSSIYHFPTTGIRFFTVYGPYGRPDMSLYKFISAMLDNENILLHNYGKHYRDFTYVGDVVKCIKKLISKKSKSSPPYQIINVGSSKTYHLKTYLKIIQALIKKNTKIVNLRCQKGDVLKSHADITKLKKIISYQPDTSLKKGINEFIKWYRDYINN